MTSHPLKWVHSEEEEEEKEEEEKEKTKDRSVPDGSDNHIKGLIFHWPL